MILTSSSVNFKWLQSLIHSVFQWWCASIPHNNPLMLKQKNIKSHKYSQLDYINVIYHLWKCLCCQIWSL